MSEKRYKVNISVVLTEDEYKRLEEIATNVDYETESYVACEIECVFGDCFDKLYDGSNISVSVDSLSDVDKV